MNLFGKYQKKNVRNERGAVLVLVALTFTIFLGLAAFAIDFNHLYVVHNELQNAADAAALAGAQALYTEVPGYEPGEKVNTNANAIAKETGLENLSDNSVVEINWTSGNTGDVQRGHWSFSNDKFTPLDTEDPVAIWGVSSDDLDKMDGTYPYVDHDGNTTYPENVNAVRVVTRRKDVEAESFFARIYGFMGFEMSAEAVAYIGFAGSLDPLEMDVPIAICDTSLTNDLCNIGRMINSADTSHESNTAAWVDSNPLSNEDACQGGTNARILGDLIGDIKTDTNENNTACECISPEHNQDDECGVNNDIITGDTWLEAIGGQVSSGYNPMVECYDTYLSEQPWEMTLPVVKCDGGQIEGCLDVDGAVTVNMIFMAAKSSPTEADTPYKMTKTDAENFPDWDSSAECSFFYQLAGVQPVVGKYNEVQPILDSDGNQVYLYNAALLDDPVYETKYFPDNRQKYAMPYLPGTEFVADADGNYDYVVEGKDPWLLGDRWGGVNHPSNIYTADKARWDCFTYHFNLQHQDGSYAPFQAKALYFMPDCEYHAPKGTTTDVNFGIRAKYPVLVD